MRGGKVSNNYYFAASGSVVGQRLLQLIYASLGTAGVSVRIGSGRSILKVRVGPLDSRSCTDQLV
jgi:hypothetical protein